ncbi:MAG TPA: histidine phosphatase family protein [Stellaceae bacterium]|nr:histidine phosphatase family protein [Stellaceae bacterium]
MHQLHLLRHAKSSWDDDADDHARPLNKRGREGARLIGESLPRAIDRLDLVLCSSALRTRETAELALAGFGTAPKILYEDALYLATEAALLQRLRDLDESIDTVMVIGHNPGLHELAVALAAPGSAGFSTLANGKFPTGVRCRFVIGTPWVGIGSTRHRLVDYVTVKSLGGKD